MADYDASYTPGEIEFGFRVSTDSVMRVDLDSTVFGVPGGVSVSVTTYFLMRGYRPLTSDYETWVATGSPNTSNPSGEPIMDVTVQNSWSG